MDYRPRNLPTKRIFGKDITNLQRRTKNASICEKPTASLPQNRQKSRSFTTKPYIQTKDPLNQYESGIFTFMLSLQRPQKQQLMTHINEDMRMILIDWLVDVHLSFELKEQTLHLALCYLNEYSSINEISKQQYQLVGIACLWIASKYEEIYPPKMSNYIQVTDSSYTATELKAMEGKIISALNFNLNYITPLQILETISDKWPKQLKQKMGKDNKGPQMKLTHDGNKTLFMCKYLIQLSLFQGLSRNFCMKTIVSSALMLSDSILKLKTQSKLLDTQQVEKSEKEQLMKCFKEMCIALQNSSKPMPKMKAIKKKYMDDRHMNVSKYRIEHR